MMTTALNQANQLSGQLNVKAHPKNAKLSRTHTQGLTSEIPEAISMQLFLPAPKTTTSL